jgi:hypothetical protein
MTHQQAVELLPWLANDSLQDAERAAVEEHASACVICRRELVELQELGTSITRLGDDVAIPAPDMRRINARIDDLLMKQTRGQRAWERLVELFDNPWRVAFAAQSAVLLAIAVGWIWPATVEVTPEPAFTTLTSPQTQSDGRYLRVVLDPSLDEAGVANLLIENELSIVDGPSARGVYTLGVADDAAALDAVAQALRSKPGVLLAEPVVVGTD